MADIREGMKQEFDQQSNYQAILKKIEKQHQKKKKRNVTIFVPVCSLAVALVMLITLSPRLFPQKQKHQISNQSQNQIVINKVDAFLEASFDADVKIIDSIPEKQTEQFSFLNHLSLPEGVFLTNHYLVYVKQMPQEEYTKLHDYVYSYSTHNSNKTITLSFSTIGTPLRDYYLGENGEASIIKGAKLQIYQYEKMYMVIGSYQGLYFDIETQGVTQNELISLLESIF